VEFPQTTHGSAYDPTVEARIGVSIGGAPAWGALEAPGARELWNSLAPALAEALRERSRELSEGMMERIRSDVPELLPTPDEAEINRASNEANLLLIAELLEAGVDPVRAQLPAPTRAYAEFGADSNTPIAGLLRAYRIGHAYAWEQMLAGLRELCADEESFAAAVALFSAWLHAYIDAVVCQGEAAYEEERERWLRSSSALRTELIKTILDGGVVDTTSASARLGYELDRHHLALIAWIDEAEPGDEVLGELEGQLQAAATAAGCPRPVIHPIGLAASAAWLGSSGELELDAIATTAAAGGPVRLAAGEQGEGVQGFRDSYRQAAEARRVAQAAAGAAPLTSYVDVALRALASADDWQAERFVRDRLGPLLDPEQASAKLTETLAAFLDEGASFGRAAGRLGVHENTVRYRIRQVEELLGRPVGPGDLELRVALELAG
jgi:hypothetical protein